MVSRWCIIVVRSSTHHIWVMRPCLCMRDVGQAKWTQLFPCLHQVSQSGRQCSMVSQLVKHQPQPETSGEVRCKSQSWTEKVNFCALSQRHGIVIRSSAQGFGVAYAGRPQNWTKWTQLLLVYICATAGCGLCKAHLSLYAWWRWHRIWDFYIQIIILM